MFRHNTTYTATPRPVFRHRPSHRLFTPTGSPSQSGALAHLFALWSYPSVHVRVPPRVVDERSSALNARGRAQTGWTAAAWTNPADHRPPSGMICSCHPPFPQNSLVAGCTPPLRSQARARSARHRHRVFPPPPSSLSRSRAHGRCGGCPWPSPWRWPPSLLRLSCLATTCATSHPVWPVALWYPSRDE